MGSCFRFLPHLWEPGRQSRCVFHGFAVDAIDRAETQILVTAYGLTASSTVEALLRAKQRGVDVRLIADKTTPCERKSGIDPLARAGIPIAIDHGARIAHAKSMVIDGKVTLTGSMNWTGSAAQNSENLDLVALPTIAAAYAGHWNQRLELSPPYQKGDQIGAEPIRCYPPQAEDNARCSRTLRRICYG